MKPTGLSESYVPGARSFGKYTKVNNLISEIICSQTGICCIK
jgi:hypothetical protein